MREMIVITDIKYHKVPGMSAKIARLNDEPPSFDESSFEASPLAVEEETVEGQFFCYPDGRTVCLGMSKKVQEILGIPLSAFSEMSNRLITLERRLEAETHRANMLGLENQGLRLCLEEIRSMGFLKRLKGAFFGFDRRK